MTTWENLTGIEGAEHGYLGKRFTYARKESKKGIWRDFLVNVMQEIGLSNYLPQQPAATDAFRRACQNIGKTYHLDKSSGKKYKIGVVMIDESADPILRNIQITEIDKENRSTTDGKVIAQIQFHRQGEYISTCWHGAIYDLDYCADFVRDRIEDAVRRYQIERELVSEQQIHNIVQKILSDAGNPVNKIPSTWNIPSTREELLDKLLLLAERLNEYEEDIFVTDTLPVVSGDPAVAEKVKNDAIIYAVARLNAIYAKGKDDISVARDVEKTTERVKGQLKAEGEKVISLIEEYEALLGEAMDEVHQARQITKDKLKEFAESPEQQAKHREGKRKLKTSKKVSGPLEDKPSNVKPVRRIRSLETQVEGQYALAL